jgi:Tfp pilus assembly major pilin PilA
MEKKNGVQREEGKEEAISPEVVCPAKTISELATQLESGSINAASLSGRARRGCALFFKSLRYENADIAAILNVGVRQVQRYFEKSKEETALALEPDFQGKIVDKIMKRSDARIQRMIRLSHAKDLSSYERARIIGMCHQIDMDNMALLEKYGYLNKDQAKIDIDRAAETRKIEDEMRHREMFIKLTKSQQQQIQAAITEYAKESIKREKEICKSLDEMYFGFVEENKKVQGWEDVQNQNSNSSDKAITN